MTSRRASLLLAVLALAAIGGCSGAFDAQAQRASENAYEDALRAMADGDMPAANDLLTEAIAQGHLQPDTYVNAHIQRALCRARLGEFEAAHADLDQVEAGAADLASVYAARAFVLLKQGRMAESQAASAQARRLNPAQ